jgi:hypothetical protein
MDADEEDLRVMALVSVLLASCKLETLGNSGDSLIDKRVGS